MKHEYKEYISKKRHAFRFLEVFSISSSWTLLTHQFNGLFSESTSGFFQTDQPHVKLILSSHATSHTGQYEPALPSQNNINRMNLCHQKLFLYSCTYGAAKGKHMVLFGSLMVSRSVLPPLTPFSTFPIISCLFLI